MFYYVRVERRGRGAGRGSAAEGGCPPPDKKGS